MSADNTKTEKAFSDYLPEYRAQLKQGHLQQAYKGLMEYFDGLKLHLSKKYPDYFVSNSVHYGYMDYTYFYFFPKTLKRQGLKIVILFIHESFRFEVWLAGYNKNIQAKYCRQIKEHNWNKYRLPAKANGDSILEHVLVENADFTDLDSLTKKIEVGTLRFIDDIESFLSNKPL
ncbi:MAG: hypothetical protein NWE92_12150 [Candidatus Bathyarchaeota archaeon]|nr:hypothetical protein [Candidatus Bathyarchaeota archaeon]